VVGVLDLASRCYCGMRNAIPGGRLFEGPGAATFARTSPPLFWDVAPGVNSLAAGVGEGHTTPVQGTQPGFIA